jgi:hypothetical protein
MKIGLQELPFVDVAHQFIGDVANSEGRVFIPNSLDMVKERSTAYKITEFLSSKHNRNIFYCWDWSLVLLKKNMSN